MSETLYHRLISRRSQVQIEPVTSTDRGSPLRSGARPPLPSFVCGGSAGAAEGYASDTWEYDFAKNRWTEIAPDGQTPAPRQLASLVFCPTVGRAILFGGGNSKGFLNDIWAFDRGTRRGSSTGRVSLFR
jgi:hypothetical protein